MCRVFFICAGVTLIACATGIADDKNDIVTLCRDGYIQAKQSIKSISCESKSESYQEASVAISGMSMPENTIKCDIIWHEMNGVAKCKVIYKSTNTRVEEHLWKDGVVKHRSWGDGQGNAGYGSLDGHKGLYPLYNVWRAAFLESNHEAVERLKTKPLKYIGIEKIADDLCHKISMDWGDATEYFWFDPKKNYLVRRTRYCPDYNKNIYFESEIEKYTEPKPGIWFASQGISRKLYKDVVNVTGRWTFRNVVINGPIPESTFQMKFSSGTTVTDVRAGTTYTVGENEEIVGPVVPKAIPRNLSPAEVQMPTGVTLPGQAPSQTPLWVWAVTGVGVLVAGVIGYGLWRRKREA